jgi:hypothetical protein
MLIMKHRKSVIYFTDAVTYARLLGDDVNLS